VVKPERATLAGTRPQAAQAGGAFDQRPKAVIGKRSELEVAQRNEAGRAGLVGQERRLTEAINRLVERPRIVTVVT